MLGTDPDQAERQISQWEQGFMDKAERSGAMRAHIEQIQVTESSADGAVRVTIDSSGAPIDLALTSKISGIPPSEVAAVVMDCMRRAQQQLAGQLRHAMAATVGAEEPVVEHVLSGYPQRFGEDQEDRTEPDPGVLDDDSPQHPASRYHAAPGADEEDFGDRNYLR
ncbi:MAG: YbaB/EbfC family nucleoid-associated protein [Pseudonocardiaceae bacterium]